MQPQSLINPSNQEHWMHPKYVTPHSCGPTSSNPPQVTQRLWAFPHSCRCRREGFKQSGSPYRTNSSSIPAPHTEQRGGLTETKAADKQRVSSWERNHSPAISSAARSYVWIKASSGRQNTLICSLNHRMPPVFMVVSAIATRRHRHRRHSLPED